MIASFYDQLSSYYEYIFQDWNASVDRQAGMLDELIREHFGSNVHAILDAACGIGTQAIGLAEKGYRLTASDISTEEIKKARLEASRRNLAIDFCVADMRHLAQVFQTRFGLVIACDNALPHLLTDSEILQTFEQFHQITMETGGCLISVRYYDAMERSGSKLYPRQVHDVPNGKIVLFDRCELPNGNLLDATIFEFRSWANIVALTRNGEVILVKQYRHGICDVLMEFPGGVVEDGEDPMEGAKRELLEETGYTASRLVQIGQIYPNPALQTNTLYCFIALDVEKAAGQNLDPGEDIEVCLVPLDGLVEMAKRGKFPHALMNAVLFSTLAYMDRIQ